MASEHFLAFTYNMALIPLVEIVLYPFFGITIRPEFANLAIAMSSITMVSLLSRRYMPQAKFKILDGMG